MLYLLSLFTFLAGTPAAPTPLTVTVRNPLAVARPAETVSLPLARAAALVQRVGAQNLVVKDAQTGAVLVSQLLDANADGTPDELLFQTAMPARGTRKFILDGAPAGAPRPASAHTTFARFVPERTDDFAWENERVAFRTYGPVAEQLFDKKDPAGTLTSGMDCWLKRVDYPIINKWYAQHVLTPFSYHKDVGEGYDPYHVGLSRGVGGTGVWDRDSLYVSRNFTSYKVLATGPIRAVFELTYAPWDANGRRVTERKVISLDLGSNLTRYEDHLASAGAPLPNCTIGLTLHDQKGSIRADEKAGYFRYWEAIDDSFLGTAVVLAPQRLLKYEDHRTKNKDQNQLYIAAKVPPGPPVVFYAGFGWAKSGQFRDVAAWDAYLQGFAQRLAAPLQVQF
ncbi:DUF4861 domain-containing protein [Hymenobacter nivis]|uniref:DUF4861 domain-containing protein n=1 Tax=Hymenobacter nivis TaxID=1850093 RepID=A0A502GZJ1_9BACT|nr:DUF4861 domain-containing protein [Hymenobacter nivis]TPG66560.1 DUF4861 domain-containing protein [Hymenobacter nivis]